MSRFKKIGLYLSAIGPGLFLIGYNIGTGSVTTMAKAGANYGMSLFWALVLSCIFTYVLMVAYGQVTLVTGQTALFNFKKKIRAGLLVSIYILAAVVIGELLAIIGVMGIVVDLLAEGFRIIGLGEIRKIWITSTIIGLMFVLLWFGRYSAFEKVLTFFVIQMGVCFIIVFFMVRPDTIAILKGLVPSVPDQEGAFALVAAMAGTTCSSALFVVRSIVVAEKGWTIMDLNKEKKDALVSSAMMLFLSSAIMAVAAGTLHIMGLKLNNTVEMIRLFEPLGGRAAAIILILGIVGAGLSTIFPIILIAPWLYCDITGKTRNIKSPLFRTLGFIGLLFGFGLHVIDKAAPAMMIFSQAIQACILPAVAIPITLMITSRETMGENTAGPLMKAGLLAVIIFSLITTWFALKDLLFI
ncbi:MAG TPA: Nramp family divalent metal transporter [Cyclobacteriaceae bacterium]|nr:Nramp family divalent metal transporter [Cyclobacteriaceae bacterium]